MSLNDLANLGQVIGALAVVISLIYVAFQIRQNTNAIRSATTQTVHALVRVARARLRARGAVAPMAPPVRSAW
jgi:hypothetical protein